MSKLDVRIAGLTDHGLFREKNEDAVWVDPGAGLVIVANGMGGHASGEKASAIAIRCIPETLSGPDGTDSNRDPRFSAATNRLAHAVRQANRAIFEEGQSSPPDRGMGTTCTAVLINADRMSLAHVGDSRCYLVRRGELTQLTEDHSLAMEQVRQGLITLEEAQHAAQNYLTRALGTEREVQVDMDECDLFPGDIVILCSDGLDKEVRPSEIRDAALATSIPDSLARRLIDMALAHGGSDNITVAVASVSRPGFMDSVRRRLTPRS
jgi:protein phosphatase